jgi:pilus assembly protein CpaE
MNNLYKTDESEDAAMSTSIQNGGPLGPTTLSLLLIGPHLERRRAVAKSFSGAQAIIARELSTYPAVDDLPRLIQDDYDGVLIDLDSNPEEALEVIENLCSLDNSITVMIYSARSDSELLVRCMRAGAREFLAEPVLPTSAGEALVRAAVRRGEVRQHRKATNGKLLVFVGAKGGSGVTTLASNFAVALAKHGKSALLDLNLQLGDVALTLGLTNSFTALDALENLHRLDSDFLSSLMVKHSSGLEVLTAPDRLPVKPFPGSGIDQILRIARQHYEFVIVDAGSSYIGMYDELFQAASAVYLVTQIAVADLRNASRFIMRYFSGPESERLEIVLNRDTRRNVEIDDESITKALTKPAKWKVPNDFAAVRRAQNTGVPLVAAGNHNIARAIAYMAGAASGQVAARANKRFSLFG